MIRLHHIPGSRSFRILWLLEELGLAYDIQPYRLDDGSTRQPGLLALSPAGRVPALEIDGQAIFESGAILQYLLERQPEAGLAPLHGAADRARFLEWLHFSETQAALLEQLNIQHIFLRPPEARSPVLMKLLARRLAVTMQAMDRALTGQDTLLAGGFSAADVAYGFNIPAVFRFVQGDAFPALQAYATRMAARPAFQRAQARDGAGTIYARDFYEVPDV